MFLPAIVKKVFAELEFDEFYLDYLDTSMIPADNAADKSSIINYSVRQLREFAKVYNKFVWVCAQAKVLVDADYTKDAFCESTAICNAATLGLILHKKREYDGGIDATHVLEIVKYRYMSQYATSGTSIFLNMKGEDGSIQYSENPKIKLNGEYINTQPFGF